MRYEYIPLKDKYEKEVVPALMKEFGYKNIHEVPKLVKIVVNMGIGEGSRNADIVEKHAQELSIITGQKAVVTRAKKKCCKL